MEEVVQKEETIAEPNTKKDLGHTHTKEQNIAMMEELKTLVKDAGLMDKIPLRGSIEVIIVLSLFVISFLSVGNTAPIISIGLFVLTIMRSTFVAHDLIHHQYYNNRETNKKLSLVFANLIMGISASWWENKHNVLHHTFTNIIDKDKDIESAGGAFIGRYEFSKFFHRNQHILFWPMLTLIYFSFWVQSVQWVIQKKKPVEALLMALNIVVVIYVAKTIGLGSLIAIYLLWSVWFSAVIITNHLGLEMFDEEEYKEFTWLDLQVRTSRDVRGGKFIHWLYGGLNTQTEHHLYPKMPRFNLLKAQAITEDFCKKNGVMFIANTPCGTYSDIYNFLKDNRPD
jgi:fatty acid desaturase